MQKLLFTLLLILLFLSCKNKEETESTVIETLKKETITTSIYPKAMTTIFDAHGGIDKWNAMKTLSFSIENSNGKETTTINLKNRAELIDTPTYTLGFDGSMLWVNEKNGHSYKGNAKFYKGLMFYFFAMPFILGDDGIMYDDVEPLIFEGKTYPGVLISYDTGIGVSPNDQYIIYFDIQTGQMEWLAYTVTFEKDKKSKDFRFIRYNSWQIINGLVMPKRIDWYTYKNNKPMEKRNTVIFTDVKLSKTYPDDLLFVKPEEAMILEY